VIKIRIGRGFLPGGLYTREPGASNAVNRGAGSTFRITSGSRKAFPRRRFYLVREIRTIQRAP
jgi:hypothetical protein